MGSDSAKTHEAFSVAPSDLDEDAWGDDLDDAEESPDTSTPEGKLAHTATLIAGLAEHTEADHLYEDLCWLVATAGQELGEAGLPAAEHDAWQAKIAAAAAVQLALLPDDKLQQLAAAAGFAHPLLVSGGALAHWLNPAHQADAPSKANIQAKAAERYGQLAAGEVETVHGHTFAEVQAAQPTPAEPSGWTATPAQVALALAGVNQRLTDLDPGGEGDGGLGALLAAERHLQTAACPGLAPADLDAAKAAASGLIGKQLAALPSYQRNAMVAAAVADALAGGAIGEPQARWLDREGQLALLRAATPGSVRDHLDSLAGERAGQVAAIHDAIAACSMAGGTSPAGAASVAAWATAHGQLHEARTAAAPWAGEAADRPALAALGVTSTWALAQEAKQRTTAWRAWAKQQPMPALRQAATELGLAGATAASRAHVQNFIAARWDPAIHGEAIQQQASGETPKKPAPPVAGNPSKPAPVTPIAAAAGGWRAKHAAAVAALKAHQAVAADIPAPEPVSAIAALVLSKGAPAAVGGMHTKTLHTDEHGRGWLHKPDKTGGARAHAEAAAARLHHLAGIRTPPVYVRDAGGKPGSLQPWVAGAEQLPADVSQWTQAEVDSVVRFHVASWMCSNHDGNPSNILRTSSGGLTPIDHGQAWRYFGEDRLAGDYDPNAAYGNPPPAYLTAYKAAASGKLGKHVRVRPAAALPVIKAFEQIDDAQLRTELEPVAHAGVKAGLPWASRMRKAAAKRLGTTAVSDADVADEFCRQAIARKQRLRQDFAQLFAGLGLDGGSLTKVA